MRGKEPVLKLVYTGTGITPAYAGKRTGVWNISRGV